MVKLRSKKVVDRIQLDTRDDAMQGNFIEGRFDLVQNVNCVKVKEDRFEKQSEERWTRTRYVWSCLTINNVTINYKSMIVTTEATTAGGIILSASFPKTTNKISQIWILRISLLFIFSFLLLLLFFFTTHSI